MEKVSIIIPAYNRPDYLREALSSAINQSYKNIEIIVVDDGSDTDIKSVVEGMKRDEMVYHRQDNRGLPSARNTGIGLCRGAYVVFLDDDDLLETDMVEECIKQFSDSVGVVFADFQYFGAPRHRESPQHQTQGAVDGQDWSGREIFKWFLTGNRIAANCLMAKKEWLQAVGGFDETLKGNEDWDAWLRIAYRGCGFRHVPKVLARVRIHKNRMQRERLKMAESGLEVFKKVEKYADKNILNEINFRKEEAYHYLLVGKALLEMGQVKKAREILRKSVKDDVNILNFCYFLGSYFIPPVIFNSFGRFYRKRMGRIY